jgi:hypothetical protein
MTTVPTWIPLVVAVVGVLGTLAADSDQPFWSKPVSSRSRSVRQRTFRDTKVVVQNPADSANQPSSGASAAGTGPRPMAGRRAAPGRRDIGGRPRTNTNETEKRDESQGTYRTVRHRTLGNRCSIP